MRKKICKCVCACLSLKLVLNRMIGKNWLTKLILLYGLKQVILILFVACKCETMLNGV